MVATIDAVASGGLDVAWSTLIPLAAAAGGDVVAIDRRGTLAWPVVTEAVATAGLDPPGRPSRWAWRKLVTPIPFRPRQVVRVANLHYGDHRRQRLDVHHRRDLPSGGRVLLYLHSGGYFSGSKHREGRAKALLHRLTARGWVCIGATYRRESPNAVVAIDLPGGQHGFDLWRSWRYTAALAGIDQFVSDPDVTEPTGTHHGDTRPVEHTTPAGGTRCDT